MTLKRYAFGLLALLALIQPAAAVDTYTSSCRLVQMATGSNDTLWGIKANAAFNMSDECSNGYVAVSVTAANVTLSTANNATDQSRNATIVLTGTPGTTRTITVPNVEKRFWIVNNSDSAATITTGSGTTVSIAASGRAEIYTDGATNVVALLNLTTGTNTFLTTPSSANLAAALTDETGTGAAVFANTPSLVTPSLGTATATGLTITSASASALTVGRLGATTPALQIDASTATSITGVKVKSAASGGGVAVSAIGETNVGMTIDSAGSGTLVLQATGTGAITLSRATTVSSTLTFPTPFTLGATSVTSTGTQLNYLSAATGTTGTASTNVVFSTAAALTAPTIAGGTHTAITSLGIRSTGAAFDLTLASSEVLTAGRTLSVSMGDAARTLTLSGSPSLSGITTTGSGTLALGTKTLTVSNTLTLAGTDSTVMTFPSTSATIARTDAGQTFTGTNVFGIVQATSLALGGATIGSDALGITGSATISSTIASAAHTVTSASATSLAVGRLGASTPAFTVDSSTGTQVAGFKITGAATGGTVALVATDSGSDTSVTFNAKGTGTIGIGSVSTGRVTITPVTTITGALTLSSVSLVYNGVTLTGATGSGNMMLSASPTTTGTLTAAAASFSGQVNFTNSSFTISSNGIGAVGGSTTNGAILIGQGSTNDVSLANTSGSIALRVPTGTQNVATNGSLTIAGALAGVTTLNASGLITGGAGQFNGITNIDSTTGSSFVSNLTNSHASGPQGLRLAYSASAPNDSTHWFWFATDNSATRAYLRSDGGIGNFSANNVNLSDAHRKNIFGIAGSQLDIIRRIEVRDYSYKDAPDKLNIGMIAQQVLSVDPSMVNTNDNAFGIDPATGKGYLSLFEAQLPYRLWRGMQEVVGIADDHEKRLKALEDALAHVAPANDNAVPMTGTH